MVRAIDRMDFKSGVRRISVMGSTGSIGTQTVDIIRCYPERFEAVALTAGRNWKLLAEQALSLRPRLAVIADESYLPNLRKALEGSGTEVSCGPEGLKRAATMNDADIVVGALVGYSGLPSTVEALRAGKTVALANKETLVVAGEMIDRLIREGHGAIIPVDSEHSAIFQCLRGENRKTLRKIILTASGGPFRNLPKENLEEVTVEQALNHPNWQMGAKVTIDSATMMNKGFEMIEARWLFDTAPEKIQILVHPESVVHSMVEFDDGSVKAQLGVPDMRLPIEVALAFPGRLDLLDRIDDGSLDLTAYSGLTFARPDAVKFPLLEVAYSAAKAGGLVPALMNAANEVAVKAFLEGRIRFTDIFCIVASSIEEGMGAVENEEVNFETIREAHLAGTKIAREKTGR